MKALQPERVLRLLDSLDGLACALRLLWAGGRGRPLRVTCLLAVLALCTAAMVYPAISAG